MNATIEVRGLRKRYGPTLALDEMTFTAAAGQVTGFVGPNGAGKSTTMRVVLGLDAARRGQRAGRRRPLRPPAAADAPRRARCSTPAPCSPAGPAAITCCGWPTRRAWASAGWMRSSPRPGWAARPGGRPAATRSACASGWASPPPARRPARAAAGRAVQRAGPRGHRVDARLPARPGRPGTGGAGVQPPDGRAAGHRRSSGRGRPRQGDRRCQHGRARWPPRPGTG